MSLKAISIVSQFINTNRLGFVEIILYRSFSTGKCLHNIHHALPTDYMRCLPTNGWSMVLYGKGTHQKVRDQLVPHSCSILLYKPLSHAAAGI